MHLTRLQKPVLFDGGVVKMGLFLLLKASGNVMSKAKRHMGRIAELPCIACEKHGVHIEWPCRESQENEAMGYK